MPNKIIQVKAIIRAMSTLEARLEYNQALTTYLESSPLNELESYLYNFNADYRTEIAKTKTTAPHLVESILKRLQKGLLFGIKNDIAVLTTLYELFDGVLSNKVSILELMLYLRRQIAFGEEAYKDDIAKQHDRERRLIKQRKKDARLGGKSWKLTASAVMKEIQKEESDYIGKDKNSDLTCFQEIWVSLNNEVAGDLEKDYFEKYSKLVLVDGGTSYQETGSHLFKQAHIKYLEYNARLQQKKSEIMALALALTEKLEVPIMFESMIEKEKIQFDKGAATLQRMAKVTYTPQIKPSIGPDSEAIELYKRVYDFIKTLSNYASIDDLIQEESAITNKVLANMQRMFKVKNKIQDLSNNRSKYEPGTVANAESSAAKRQREETALLGDLTNEQETLEKELQEIKKEEQLMISKKLELKNTRAQQEAAAMRTAVQQEDPRKKRPYIIEDALIIENSLQLLRLFDLRIKAFAYEDAKVLIERLGGQLYIGTSSSHQKIVFRDKTTLMYTQTTG